MPAKSARTIGETVIDNWGSNRVAARMESLIARKKLVLVGPMYPYRGGIAHFLETMRSGLVERGHTVCALTFTRQYPGFLFPGKTQLDGSLVGTQPAARRTIDSINPLSWFKAARLIAQSDSEAVIFQYWMPFLAPAFGTIARRLDRHGIKTVVIVHNAIPHERHTGDITLGRYFLKAASGCVVMSDSVSSDLESMGVNVPKRLAAHPVYDLFGKTLDRQLARASLGLPPGVPVLLFFGFIRPYKGLRVLLEAMPRILLHLPDARLVVAGQCYDNEKSYRDLIGSLRLGDHIRFDSAYIPNGDVPTYFSAADVVVQPYVAATQSGVAQIAFNFDKPLITTDVGGLAEVVHHEFNGLLVPPEDAERLADAVIRFFKEDMRKRLEEGVRKKKRAFGWNALYEAVESLL